MQVVWIFVGGGLGSVARYGIGAATGKFWTSPFPLGTFLSNLFACTILGVFVYLLKDKTSAHAWISPLLLTGFCGGFSTFSALSRETTSLLAQGLWGWAIANIVVSLVAGIGLMLWMSLSR